MLADPWIPWSAQKVIMTVLKYLGILTTTVLSIYTLTLETVDKSTKPYTLTKEGWKYARLLIALTLLTSLIAVWDDHVEEQLKVIAEDKGNPKLREELMNTLKPKLEEQQGKIDGSIKRLEGGIDKATNQLDASLSKSSKQLREQLTESTDSLVESKTLLFPVDISMGWHPSHKETLEPDEAERMLALWGDYSLHEETCKDTLCKEYSKMNYTYGGSRRFLMRMWHPKLMSGFFRLTFRGFSIIYTVNRCQFWEPRIADGVLMSHGPGISPIVRCLNVETEKEHGKAKILDFKTNTMVRVTVDRDDLTDITESDTQLLRVFAELCGGDTRDVKVGTDSVLKQRVQIEVAKLTKESHHYEWVNYEARANTRSTNIAENLYRVGGAMCSYTYFDFHRTSVVK